MVILTGFLDSARTHCYRPVILRGEDVRWLDGISMGNGRPRLIAPALYVYATGISPLILKGKPPANTTKNYE